MSVIQVATRVLHDLSKKSELFKPIILMYTFCLKNILRKSYFLANTYIPVSIDFPVL